MSTLVRSAAVALALLAATAFWPASPGMAASSEYRIVKERVWLGPNRGYQWRYYYVSRQRDLDYPPTSTPVRIRPGRAFYTVPHYKSSYGPGYHTNVGPGIGLMR